MRLIQLHFKANLRWTVAILLKKDDGFMKETWWESQTMWSQVPFSLIMGLDSQVIAGYLSKGLCSSRGCAPLRRDNLWACFTLSFSSFLFALPCFQIICHVGRSCRLELCMWTMWRKKKKEKVSNWEEYVYFMSIEPSVCILESDISIQILTLPLTSCGNN